MQSPTHKILKMVLNLSNSIIHSIFHNSLCNKSFNSFSIHNLKNISKHITWKYSYLTTFSLLTGGSILRSNFFLPKNSTFKSNILFQLEKDNYG